MRKRVHVWIEGRVQGVCFRMYACEVAQGEGLAGWVRNLRDGRVEAVAEGGREAVDRFVSWCRRGPPAALVRSVAVHEEPVRGDTGDFEVTG
jgi:acylphosphatase